MSKCKLSCCVPTCKNTYNSVASFHHFPTYNEKLRQEWIRILKIKRPVSTYMRVCGNHFAKQDFILGDHINIQHRLKRNVLPTQNLPGNSKSTSATCTNQIWSSQRVERLNHLRSIKLNKQLQDKAVTKPQLLEKLNVRKSGRIKKVDKAVEANMPPKTRNIDHLTDSDYKLRIMTGINSIASLNVLIKTLNQMDPHYKGPLGTQNRILLTLMRLKLDLCFSSLGFLFKVSADSAQTYFQKTIVELSQLFKFTIVRFPLRDEIAKNVPCYFKDFCENRIALDATELEMENNAYLTYKIKTYYSYYKGRRTNTITFLIGVGPSGLVSYLSKSYRTGASDKAIFNEENAVVVDKSKEDEKLITMPSFLKKKKEINKEDAVAIAKIVKSRVRVEGSIRSLKQFHIYRNKIPWSMVPYIDDIMITIIGLNNLSNLTSSK